MEAARISAAKVLTNRVFQTAIRSTLSEYYLPLYENYHLFGLDIGYGNINLQETELIDKIGHVMNHSLQPNDINSNFQICNPSINNIVVNERRTLLDDNGIRLKNQAIHYQKYSLAADILQEFLKKVNLVEDAEKVNEILAEKLEVEAQLYKIDKDMLRLVHYIDGFLVDEAGLKLDKKGQPITADYFAKKIVLIPLSKDSLQINNQVLYEAIKDKYINPLSITQSMVEYGELARIEKAEVDRLTAELSELRNHADYDDLSYLIKESELIYELFSAERNYQTSVAKIGELQGKLNALFNGTMKSIEEAIICIKNIKDIRKDAKSGIVDYIKSIEESKGILENSLYDQLMLEAKEMSYYTDDSVNKVSIIYNIIQMEETLLRNQELLKEIKAMNVPTFTLNSSGYQTWKDTIIRINNSCSRFSHAGLAIDYSGIRFNKSNNEVLSNYKSLIKSGIAGLVIEDLDKVSKASISAENVISASYYIQKESSLEDMDKLMSNASENKEEYNTKSSLNQAGISISSMLEDGAVPIVENLLYIAYLEEHFTSYLDDKATSEKVLAYELEYILFGNETDEKNLESVAMKIIIIRTVMNLLHVLTDTKKAGTALQFATGVVGFTGLPFLISITKYIVLFIWAFEAALVETAAILLGKKVPILVTDKNFVVKFDEIFTMGKNNIIKKAKGYKNEGEISFDYKDYLRLFILLQNKPKQYYRTMDLIQENIRYVYDDTFLLSRCITEYEAKANIYMPEVFLSMPFMAGPKAQGVSGYHFSLNAAVSY